MTGFGKDHAEESRRETLLVDIARSVEVVDDRLETGEPRARRLLT